MRVIFDYNIEDVDFESRLSKTERSILEENGLPSTEAEIKEVLIEKYGEDLAVFTSGEYLISREFERVYCTYHYLFGENQIIITSVSLEVILGNGAKKMKDFMNKLHYVNQETLKAVFNNTEYERIDALVKDLLRDLEDVKEPFIKLFGEGWYDYILDDTNCAICELDDETYHAMVSG